MVIIVGTLKVDPAQRDAFVAGRIEAMKHSRAEEGCITYAITADPVEADTVIVTERWSSQAALDAHAKAMREAAKNAAPMAFKVLDRELTVYEVASSRPL